MGVRGKIKNSPSELILRGKNGHFKYMEYIKSDLHNFDLWLLLISLLSDQGYKKKNTILLSAPLHSHISSRISSTQAINNQTLDEEVLQKKKKSVDLLALQFILTQSRWGGRGGENKWQMKSHPSRLQLQTSKSKKRKATFRGRSHDPPRPFQPVSLWLADSQ